MESKRKKEEKVSKDKFVLYNIDIVIGIKII